MNKADYKAIAEQLRCPSGSLGEQTADNMFRTNGNMINETIDMLDIRPNGRVLEIGFGSARHLPYLLGQAAGITYFGLDMSELMVDLARANNGRLIRDGVVRFLKVTGDAGLDFPEGYFASSFSVNTLYFWKQPIQHLKEINRVLKREGLLALSFVPVDFARTLPFTRHGFSLYSPTEVEHLLLESGFSRIYQYGYKEKTISNSGQEMIRPFVIVTGTKI